MKTEIDTKFAALPASSVDLGSISRLVKSTDTKTCSIERYSLNVISNSNVWMSLFSIVYDVDSMHCRLIVDKTDMVDKINNKLDDITGNASMAAKTNSGLDVFICYNTKDVSLFGNCYISNDLTVYGGASLGNSLTVNANGCNGTIKCVPLVDTAETSLAFL